MIVRGSLCSTVLEMDTGVTIITPEQEFPEPPSVAYVFHGLGADSGSWADSSMLPSYSKDYNVLFVMPEVGRSYYMDLRYGQRFFEYVSNELPSFIERTFRVRTGAENTAAMGASMGGYGALKCALASPERFGRCCAFAAGNLYAAEFLERVVRIGDWDKVATILGRQRVADFRMIYGDALEVRPEDELSLIAANAAKNDIKSRFYCACGTDDGFLRNNRRFVEKLKELEFDVTYEEWPGGHEWDFFNTALRKALYFCYGEGKPREILVPKI